MALLALLCPKCARYAPLVERSGHVVIACSEHGDTPLYRRATDETDKTQYTPATWTDLKDESEEE